MIVDIPAKVNELPKKGALCLSCGAEMPYSTLNGCLLGYMCPDNECVRYGLVSMAWKERKESSTDDPSRA